MAVDILTLSTKQRRAILAAAEKEWQERRESDLKEYWPRGEIPYSYMTHHANFALPRQGYTHWWKMFNSRQLTRARLSCCGHSQF